MPVHCVVVPRTVLMCDTEGNRLRRYHLQRVNDMVLSADGRTLVMVACEHKIKLLRLHESREVIFISVSEVKPFPVSLCCVQEQGPSCVAGAYWPNVSCIPSVLPTKRSTNFV